ncbi:MULTISPECIES: 3,4-dihydroxy-2-butanone-4-phosphate synthase [Rhodococcus]|nr:MULTISPECIES: 3,4-dihydroxy-2-butanone-4-phosphate synthase [Rhodococcus]QRI77344.1 3,4-dihydroxy-2-butanone-4-phosphate synthase [Rhodococcus aetherivorans]QSE60764.1 3,4-dihydroxy-2-butanone-4-phosphate synthase [Rhodococcus sp. PSBB066]QSE67928.1 3,4-dihydroxy-2-butanone-4-phosphate synthase [Rhodococcus sp. PSBB049]
MSIAEFRRASRLDPRCPAGARVRRAAADISAGRMTVLVDPTCGESTLVVAAECATTESMAFMIRHTSGYVNIAVPEEDCERLHLPRMWPFDGSASSIPAVTVDAVEGVGTGISAADRAHTIRTIADPRTDRSALSRPGHVAPVIARNTGTGTAEKVVQLMRTAGMRPMAAMCELVSPVDATRMATEKESVHFATDHELAFLSVFDLAVYSH